MFSRRNTRNAQIIISILGIICWGLISAYAYQQNAAVEIYRIDFLDLAIWNFGVHCLLIILYLLLFVEIVFLVNSLHLNRAYDSIPFILTLVFIQICPNKPNAVIESGISGIIYFPFFWSCIFSVLFYFWLKKSKPTQDERLEENNLNS